MSRNRKKFIVLFAWWFLAIGSATGYTGKTLAVVGPFPSEEACKKYVEWFVSSTSQHNNNIFTKASAGPCWSDKE